MHIVYMYYEAYREGIVDNLVLDIDGLPCLKARWSVRWEADLQQVL